MPYFDADQWSVLLITVIFGAARLTVAAFAVRPLMSQLGQKLKSSIRAKVFRFAPWNGHRATTVPFRAKGRHYCLSIDGVVV
jgi:hypothetical protein